MKAKKEDVRNIWYQKKRQNLAMGQSTHRRESKEGLERSLDWPKGSAEQWGHMPQPTRHGSEARGTQRGTTDPALRGLAVQGNGKCHKEAEGGLLSVLI